MQTTPRSFPVAFTVCALVFLLLDALWLWSMADRLYRPAIGHLMREGFDVVAAAMFYVLYLSGVVVLIVMPSRSVREAGWRGALFGLVAYATYDLTNQATLRGWSWTVTLADLAWGAFATAVSCACARYALHRRASHPAA